MSIKPIKTKPEYEKALAFVEKHFNARANSKEGMMIEVLAILIEKYEGEHFPIEDPTPAEAIQFRMEQLGLSAKDLVGIIGTRSRVSEILRGKRTLSIKMIRTLHKELQIPAEILLGI